MKLGELFVDLNFRKGNAINDLANFSIKFLALGKLAQEVANTFDGLFGDVMRYGVELSNTNKITGISIKLMQEMKYKSEQLGVSYDSWLSSLKGIQKTNADILMGQGSYSAFQKLGVEVSYLRDPTELLAEVMERISHLEPAFRRAVMAEAGIAEETYILYSEKAKAMRGSLLLNEKEVAGQKDLNKEWNYLTQTIGSSWNRLLVDSNGSLREAVGYVQSLVDGFIDLKDASGSWIKAFEEALEKWSKDSAIGNFFNGIFGIGGWIGEKIANTQNPNIPTLEEFNAKRQIKYNQDYFNETDRNFDYGSSSRGLNYTDNSQTIINTSDGPEQYTKITSQKTRSIQQQLSDAEFIYGR